jgi:hypothetical protein
VLTKELSRVAEEGNMLVAFEDSEIPLSRDDVTVREADDRNFVDEPTTELDLPIVEADSPRLANDDEGAINDCAEASLPATRETDALGEVLPEIPLCGENRSSVR